MDKPHPRFLASILWKKVWLIHGRLWYLQLNNATIKVSSDCTNSWQETKQFSYFFLYFIKVAPNWQLVILLFRKSTGESKSQICNFSRYFSRKGNKFSRKCYCIGHNFEPWTCTRTLVCLAYICVGFSWTFWRKSMLIVFKKVSFCCFSLLLLHSRTCGETFGNNIIFWYFILCVLAFPTLWLTSK